MRGHVDRQIQHKAKLSFVFVSRHPDVLYFSTVKPHAVWKIWYTLYHKVQYFSFTVCGYTKDGHSIVQELHDPVLKFKSYIEAVFCILQIDYLFTYPNCTCVYFLYNITIGGRFGQYCVYGDNRNKKEAMKLLQ